MTVQITVTDERFTLKMLREHLCLAQSRLGVNEQDRRAVFGLQVLINGIDDQRPLGPDGTHGDRHTLTCGCAP